ncbi:MAG: amino acid--tRNA ligase-related protein [Polyangiales bacterium]
MLAALRLRHRLARALDAFMDARDYLEVTTPTRVVSPGLDVHLDAFACHDKGRRWLRTSPEFHMRRVAAAGVPRLYQLGPAYRAGELGALHQPEFSLLEWYRSAAAGEAGLQSLMRETEALLQALATCAVGEAGFVARAGRRVSVAGPFAQLSFAAALQQYAPAALPALQQRDLDAVEAAFALEVAPQLGWDRPVFITHFPAEQTSLAATTVLAGRPVSLRAELFIAGVELSNGYVELSDVASYRARLSALAQARQRLDKSIYPVDEALLAALTEAQPPMVGNALGWDRLVMLLAGAACLDAVVFGAETTPA